MAEPVELLFGTPNIDAVKASILGLIPIFDKVSAATRGSTTRAAKDRVAAEQDANKQIGREAEKAAKERSRTARDSAREAERIAADAQRSELNFIKAGQRAIADAERDRTRNAEEESRKRQRISEQEMAAISRRARSFGGMMGGAAGRVMGTAGSVLGIAASLGGGFAISDALRSGIEQEKVAGQLVRSSATRGNLDTAGVQSAARAAAIETAHSPTQALEGLDMFIRETGNLEVGVKLLRDLSRYAAASGVAMTDLGSTAGQIFNHMNGDLGKTKNALLGLEGQARTGAIDVRNLAQYGGRLVGTAELFEGDVGSNIQTFGALTQIAKRYGGKIDAAEATEAASRIFGEVSMHSDAFTGLGVNVMGKGGKLRNVEDILLDTLVKTKGDITAIPSLFGRQAGGVEVGLAQKFLEGSGGRTDAASLASGRAAASASIRSFTSARVTEEGVDEDVKKRLAEVDGRLTIATTQFHAAINDKILPLMPELIDKFTLLIPRVQQFLNFLVSEPWKGIGAIVGTLLAAEIGKSVISGAITGVFSSLAEKFLKLFSTTNAAVANVTAGVVNVNSGGDTAKKVVEDLTNTGAGAGAGAAGGVGAGFAGTALGAGIIGAGALIPLAFGELGDRRGKQGAAALTDIMSLPDATDAQKRDKLAALEGAQARGVAGNRFHELALKGQENELGNYQGGNAERLLGNDRASQAMGKQIDQITEQMTQLRSALGVAAPAVIAFADALKPPGGAERTDVPTGAWRGTQAP